MEVWERWQVLGSCVSQRVGRGRRYAERRRRIEQTSGERDGDMTGQFLFPLIAVSFHWSEVAQSCPTLCDPVDCSPPGSSVHGVLQARILEWVAISFSRGSSRPRNRTHVSRIAGRCFNLWATRDLMALIWMRVLKTGTWYFDLSDWNFWRFCPQAKSYFYIESYKVIIFSKAAPCIFN